MDVSALLSKLILLFAAGLTLWQARKLSLALASTNWKQTKGKILKAYIDESADDDGGVTHSAKVHYSYKIGARVFESTCLTYRPSSGLVFSKALDLLQGITQGKEVDVFYDPRRPERAVLVRGSSTDNILHLIICFIFLAVALWHQLM